jgi:hypothetical protein
MHRILENKVNLISCDYRLDQTPDVAWELPPFNHWGYLPPGMHETCFERVIERFATNPTRKGLCQRLQKLLLLVIDSKCFSYAYLGGEFTTAQASPKEIDVILQTCSEYGPEVFQAIEPFLVTGLDVIHERYSVRLHFWSQGFPSGINDFRDFFQYIRPKEAFPLGIAAGAKRGIVGIRL